MARSAGIDSLNLAKKTSTSRIWFLFWLFESLYIFISAIALPGFYSLENLFACRALIFFFSEPPESSGK